jgi:hypothetical protein
MIPPLRECTGQTEQKRRPRPCELVAARTGRAADLPPKKTGENAGKSRHFHWIQNTLLLAVAQQESSASSAVLGDPIPVLDISILAGKSAKTRINWFQGSTRN